MVCFVYWHGFNHQRSSKPIGSFKKANLPTQVLRDAATRPHGLNLRRQGTNFKGTLPNTNWLCSYFRQFGCMASTTNYNDCACCSCLRSICHLLSHIQHTACAAVSLMMSAWLSCAGHVQPHRPPWTQRGEGSSSSFTPTACEGPTGTVSPVMSPDKAPRIRTTSWRASRLLGVKHDWPTFRKRRDMT